MLRTAHPIRSRKRSSRYPAATVRKLRIIGFSHRGPTAQIRIAESLTAISNGDAGIDMVITVGKALGRERKCAVDDISMIDKTAVVAGGDTQGGFPERLLYLKVELIGKLCGKCTNIGVAFVNTPPPQVWLTKNEGRAYGYEGATLRDLRTMGESCRKDV
ncbi:unnamed protein product [Tuber aestivum]|uniref:Uncharacterized protein n=1 Tax=Tuber aestivum TaxID=59557 RepID=A0A292Q215_9PEZI|nr:unnamed protein product [Tuber aestivum]